MIPFSLTYSPLAHRVTGVRNPKLARVREPWGFLLHTTGGGVTAKAKKEHRSPIATALAIYIASQNGSNGYLWGGPAYVCDHGGLLYQVAPDEAYMNHAGGPHRDQYLDGTWIHGVSKEGHRISDQAVAEWRKRWPNRRNPYSLFPSTSPNADYVGLEMIPIGDGFGGEPMRPGLRFTLAQHEAAIALGRDLGNRHGWPAGWAMGSRLVGHEDVDPIERSDAHGGWDPGAMRPDPFFDFDYVRHGIAA